MLILRQLARVSLRRGMRGSRPALVTAAVAYTIVFLVRAARADADVVRLEKVRPGDTFEISFRSRSE